MARDPHQNREASRRNYIRNLPVRVPPEKQCLATGYLIDVEVRDPKDARFGQKVSTPGYIAGQVGQVMGLTTQSVRLIINQGKLPEPAHRGTRNERVWTFDEINIIFKAVPLLGEPFGRRSVESEFSRTVRAGFGRLRDGLIPVGYVPAPEPEELVAVTTVYELVDPRDQKTRYVGISRNPRQRREQHLSGAIAARQYSQQLSLKEAWLLELVDLGSEPILRIFDRVPEHQGRQREVELMMRRTQRGHSLLNPEWAT